MNKKTIYIFIIIIGIAIIPNIFQWLQIRSIKSVACDVDRIDISYDIGDENTFCYLESDIIYLINGLLQTNTWEKSNRLLEESAVVNIIIYDCDTYYNIGILQEPENKLGFCISEVRNGIPVNHWPYYSTDAISYSNFLLKLKAITNMF